MSLMARARLGKVEGSSYSTATDATGGISTRVLFAKIYPLKSSGTGNGIEKNIICEGKPSIFSNSLTPLTDIN